MAEKKEEVTKEESKKEESKKEEPKKEPEKKLTFYQRLNRISAELKAPKSRHNDFGNYDYRSLEDIFEGLKPLEVKYDITVHFTNDIKQVGDRYYVVEELHITDALTGVEEIVVKGHAREIEDKKKSDPAQITGAASSYARKYALNGVFLIDDTKDPDTNEYHRQSESTNTVDRRYATTLENVLTKHPDIKKWAFEHYRIDSLTKLTNAQYNEIVSMLKKNENTGDNK